MFHPLINLVITLIVIIVLLRIKLPIGLVMTAAGILLGILFKVSIIKQLAAAKQAIISPTFLELGIALNMIMFLENILRTKGYLNKTLSSLRTLIPNPKINIMLLPAFLGLLPSPGGAVFSAPLVAEAGKDLEMSVETQSLVNYWFRHLWEFFFPLYPGVILAAQILSVPISKISFTLFWFSLFSAVIGYFLIIKPINGPAVKTNSSSSKEERHAAFISLCSGIWPVVLVVLAVLLFHLDVGLTVVAVIVILLLLNHYRPEDLKKLWRESFHFSLIFLIAGILFFKEMLQSSGVVNWLPVFLKASGIPDILVVICLTFLVGFAVGISQAYIATTFPLLIGIIGYGAGFKPGLVALGSISGFIGLMLTPVHLCFILTVQYFKADFLKVWRRMLVPELILLIIAILFAVFWK